MPNWQPAGRQLSDLDAMTLRGKQPLLSKLVISYGLMQRRGQLGG
jgi:hypothetical protein